MNTTKTIQKEDLKDFLWNSGMFDKLSHDDHIALAQYINRHTSSLVREIIGEDEHHKDTSFGGSLPAFETTPMVHRNQLRAEQRKKLATLENKGEDV